MTTSLHLSKIALFATTIFLSAFLLFQVQPLVSKLILPWFGGSPAVWTTAMLFFQSVLFAGYVYAHLLTRYATPRLQARIHTALLLVAAILAWWILPGPAFKPTGDGDPVLAIIALLSACVGIPYFCLATTGPLLQYWFSRADIGQGVYRLFSLSNVGSLLALLSFPYFFEPKFRLTQLGVIWSSAFLVFAAMCGAIATSAAGAASAKMEPPNASSGEAARPTTFQRLCWIALPALASLTFIATTDHISHDIAPEPRLWIATLSLYLLTFIICFDHPRWYRRAWVASACLVAVVLLSGRNSLLAWLGIEWDLGVTEIRWSHLGVMFLICFICHGELYRLRPGLRANLTEFYLGMSFGGACGGLFVALVATHFFADYYEWTMCLVAAVLLSCAVAFSEWRSRASSGMPRRTPTHWRLPAAFATLGLGLGSMVTYWQDPFHWQTSSDADYVESVQHQSRNFYGTVSVKEKRNLRDVSETYRVFYSGNITHGVQYTHESKRRVPVSYHSADSGVGETLDYAKSRQPVLRVAVVGLGAGTLATYAREQDRYDFYEINPQVVEVAYRLFWNLDNCLAVEKRIILGDARLKMEELPGDVLYDVIALDAFTGGSLPMHLLTREAFQIYRRHLKHDGFIVINITNGYLNLYPVVRRQAEALSMGYRNKYQAPDAARHIRRNQHFVITNDRRYLDRFPSVNRHYFDSQGKLLRVQDLNVPDVPLWTDQFSSLSPIELAD